jgi:hypothetical protein
MYISTILGWDEVVLTCSLIWPPIFLIGAFDDISQLLFGPRNVFSSVLEVFVSSLDILKKELLKQRTNFNDLSNTLLRHFTFRKRHLYPMTIINTNFPPWSLLKKHLLNDVEYVRYPVLAFFALINMNWR